MQRLRSLSETECYARCYGARTDTIRIVSVEARRPRYELGVSGEELRVLFEERLDAREEETEAVTRIEAA